MTDRGAATAGPVAAGGVAAGSRQLLAYAWAAGSDLASPGRVVDPLARGWGADDVEVTSSAVEQSLALDSPVVPLFGLWAYSGALGGGQIRGLLQHQGAAPLFSA
jgi:hypothetical protein